MTYYQATSQLLQGNRYLIANLTSTCASTNFFASLSLLELSTSASSNISSSTSAQVRRFLSRDTISGLKKDEKHFNTCLHTKTLTGDFSEETPPQAYHLNRQDSVILQINSLCLFKTVIKNAWSLPTTNQLSHY